MSTSSLTFYLIILRGEVFAALYSVKQVHFPMTEAIELYYWRMFNFTIVLQYQLLIYHMRYNTAS